MYRKGISLAISLIAYLIAPDILDRGETVCFILSMWMLADLALGSLFRKLLEIREKRAELSITGNRLDLSSRKNLPVNVKIKRAWPVIIPAEKVER